MTVLSLLELPRLNAQFRISRVVCFLALVSRIDKDKRMRTKDPLSVTHPELAEQAVGWDPSLPLSNQNTKKSWCCALGHLWESRISHRINGSGCPYCASQKLLSGFNDLAFLNPTLAAETDQWDASTLMPNSNIKKKWKCGVGHSWEATVANRSSGDGCPICAGKKVLSGFNDLLTLQPSLAKEALGWDPATTTRNSGKGRQWECELGHQWKATVDSRTRGRGCPVCSGKRVLAGFNDLATVLPDLALELSSGTQPPLRMALGGRRNGNANSAIFGKGELTIVPLEMVAPSARGRKCLRVLTISQQFIQNYQRRLLGGIRKQ